MIYNYQLACKPNPGVEDQRAVIHPNRGFDEP